MPGTVIGLDVGGTSTRAVVTDLDGRALGTGRAAGANPTAHGAERAGRRLAEALRGALKEVDPPAVLAGTIGIAGIARFRDDPAGRAALDGAWQEAGLRCPYELVSDAVVGYAAGTDQPTGTILIAGTGAIATQIRDFAEDRVADGHGWLLGDAGSGFWLGRGAVRHALVDLDAHREPSPLTAEVLTALLGSPGVAARPRETAQALVQRANAGPPVALSELAPLVFATYDTDAAARDLVREAASHLVRTVGVIRPSADATPIVIGGGLLTSDTPLAGTVMSALGRHWPAAPISKAGDAATAAAWLAARHLR